MSHLHLRPLRHSDPPRDGDAELRMATPEDREALAHLAALDSTHPPSGPVLVAEVDGELQAALAVSDHTVIADPFQSTAHLVERLHEHAAELAD